MTAPTPYALTAADVDELRGSVKWQLTDTFDGPARAPYITYAREDAVARNAPGYHPDAFVLHTQGHMRAISPRLEVLGACLRAEYAEPGFVARILDTSQGDCAFAVLDPASREAERRRAAFAAKAAREYAEEKRREDEARARRTPAVSQPDPASVQIEDLFDD